MEDKTQSNFLRWSLIHKQQVITLLLCGVHTRQILLYCLVARSLSAFSLNRDKPIKIGGGDNRDGTHTHTQFNPILSSIYVCLSSFHSLSLSCLSLYLFSFSFLILLLLFDYYSALLKTFFCFCLSLVSRCVVDGKLIWNSLQVIFEIIEIIQKVWNLVINCFNCFKSKLDSRLIHTSEIFYVNLVCDKIQKWMKHPEPGERRGVTVIISDCR